MIYLIGSLNNPNVTKVAARLRAEGHNVWDDWMAAGYEADKKWEEYEKGRGHGFAQALAGDAAWHVFNYDKEHLERADMAVMLMPCGRSGHLEMGWFLHSGKPGYILLPGEPDRYDVMYRFATEVFTNVEDLINACNIHRRPVPGNQLVGHGTEHQESGDFSLRGMAIGYSCDMPAHEYEIFSRSRT